MTITKRTFDKVIRFYQSLPIDLLNEIFTKIGDANRKSQRTLSKHKTIDDKINYVLQLDTREIFCDIAYDLIKANVEIL